MKTSVKGLDLIKRYEGLRLVAYKPIPSEIYYTIGYGHYGKDVKANMTITKAEADQLLKKDMAAIEVIVSDLLPGISQNAFDALVSFTYNCGSENLKKLVAGRSMKEISEKILLYNKAGGKVLAGLTRRRKEESELIKMDFSHDDNVKKLQHLMNELGADPKLVEDGIIGNKSKNAFLQLFGRVVE